jgi:hypothetical protein
MALDIQGNRGNDFPANQKTETADFADEHGWRIVYHETHDNTRKQEGEVAREWARMIANEAVGI